MRFPTCLYVLYNMSAPLYYKGEGTEEELKERQAKAMADPDVQNILMDPIMRQVCVCVIEGERQRDRGLGLSRRVRVCMCVSCVVGPGHGTG